jgi:hypothetical protein
MVTPPNLRLASRRSLADVGEINHISRDELGKEQLGICFRLYRGIWPPPQIYGDPDRMGHTASSLPSTLDIVYSIGCQVT